MFCLPDNNFIKGIIPATPIAIPNMNPIVEFFKLSHRAMRIIIGMWRNKKTVILLGNFNISHSFP